MGQMTCTKLLDHLYCRMSCHKWFCAYKSSLENCASVCNFFSCVVTEQASTYGKHSDCTNDTMSSASKPNTAPIQFYYSEQPKNQPTQVSVCLTITKEKLTLSWSPFFPVREVFTVCLPFDTASWSWTSVYPSNLC